MSSIHQDLSSFDMTQLEGANKLKIGIVTSEWNCDICENLRSGAKYVLSEVGIPNENVSEIHVPGAFELPAGAAMLLKSKNLDAVICLGCVIKGETSHDIYINQSVAIGLSQISVMTGKPVIFGVLTTDNMDQAEDRSGGRLGNKGIEAAVSALKMALLSKSLSSGQSNIGF